MEGTQDWPSWVNRTARQMLLAILSKANLILSETTDCTQSTDYLYIKRDLLVNLGYFQPQSCPN